MKGVVLVDTREQNLHIVKELERLSIPCARKKLDYGDYSFSIGEVSYENKIVIERKGSIDELIGNFTKGRDRFRREFERSKGCRVILMVEASIEQLEAGNYRSRMSPHKVKSFLKTWCNKFQIKLEFVEKDRACEFVLNCFNNYIQKEGGQDQQNTFNGSSDQRS